jgi:cytochrome c peroxidase
MKAKFRANLSAVSLAVSALAACSNGVSSDAPSVQVQRDAVNTAPATLGSADAKAPAAEASKAFNPRLLRRFTPLRARMDSLENPASEDKIALGRMLYFDKRLSRNQDVACNSCHHLDAYGVDGQPNSVGDKGQHGGRNSPTVYNAAGYLAQFWDGRARDVEEQAKGPILNPVEMAMPSAAAVVARLKSIPGYVTAFEKAFPANKDALTYDNLGRAIGAFERGLTTPARWDKFLLGDKTALTAGEMEGLKVFTNVGCMVCHTGELLGGNSYQRAGAVEPWATQSDVGRESVTKNANDKMMFKVPTLRNIEKTAPYFHDGSAKTLEDAVHVMGRHQLGLDLSNEEVTSIVTWLHSVTGELPTAYIAEPQLPPSVEKAGNSK